jgi:hypothetical protein
VTAGGRCLGAVGGEGGEVEGVPLGIFEAVKCCEMFQSVRDVTGRRLCYLSSWWCCDRLQLPGSQAWHLVPGSG